MRCPDEHVSVDDTDIRAALRLAQERFEIATLAAEVGVWDWDLLTGHLWWSDQQFKLLAVDPADFDPHVRYFKRLVLPQDVRTCYDTIEAAIAMDARRVTFRFRALRGDAQLRHFVGDARIIYNTHGRAVRMIGTNADITDRVRAQEQEQLLLAELTHRVKNTLATVQSLANQTMLTAPTMEAFRESFSGRLHAISATHTVLVESNWYGATLAEVLRAELCPYEPVECERWSADGPEIRLSPSAAINVGLVLHELTTNAVKYGALSDRDGLLKVFWVLHIEDEVERLIIDWCEFGGPAVNPPTRKGFGTRLFQKIASQFNGAITIAYESTGVRARIDLPTTTLRSIIPARPVTELA